MNGYNIYHRQDGRYEGRVSRGKKKNGKRLFKYFFGSSREEVKRKMDAFRKQDAAACSQTIGQLFYEWHTSIKHHVKESTAANYLMKAEKHILPAFSKSIADTLRQADVYAFIDSKLKAGLSTRYVSDIIIMMKSIFKFAVKKYRIFNPLDGIALPRSSKPNIKLLDDTQQKKLQTYIAENPSNTTLGIALSMSTGIRIGELCALQWEDIDLEKRILTVRKTMQRIQTPHETAKTKLVIAEPKSESSKREIPIPECVVNLLDKFKGKGKEYLISSSDKATEPRTLQYRFAGILKNVQLPSIHFHALRHMFATNCVKLGFDIKSLSEILGHSSVEITLNRYVHSSVEQKRGYMDRLKMIF